MFDCNKFGQSTIVINSIKINPPQNILIFGRKNDEHWIIEAKGETSSEKSSKRYGKLMTKNQHYSQVSTCLYKLIQEKNKKISKKGFNYGMAFPKNTIFKDLIKSIYPTVSKLEIRIFWVDNNLSVEEET